VGIPSAPATFSSLNQGGSLALRTTKRIRFYEAERQLGDGERQTRGPTLPGRHACPPIRRTARSHVRLRNRLAQGVTERQGTLLPQSNG
jgi:hypothetical protein